MPWADIRDAIQSLLEAVPGIGLVHPRLRRINNDADLRALGVVGGSNGPINLWMHSRIGFPQPLLTNMEKLKQHTWMILGYYSLSDALESEFTYQSILDGVADGIGADITLGGACEMIIDLPNLPPSDISHVLLPPGDGGVVCHFANMRMVIQDRLDR